MNWLSNLTTGLKALFHKPHVDRELNEELDSYLEASAAHKQHLGMTREQALHAARIEIGSRNSVKHQVWSSRWESALDSLFADLRQAARSLLKTPGFTLVALLSLALGIGANTAIFTLIHQVLLRDLPVQHPEQLVTFAQADSGGVLGGVDLGFYGMFPWSFSRQLQAAPGPFQAIAAFGSYADKVSIRIPGAEPSQSSSTPAILAPANLVSGNYFSALGAQPLLGRTITPADDAVPGSGSVVVISHHFWQNSLSSDPAILGKSITVNGTPFAIIGVMPKPFQGIKLEVEPTDLWAPLSMQPVIQQHPSMLTPDGPYFLHLFGRLSPQAAGDKGTLAQSQNWLNQQIRNAIRTREGNSITPARLQEINRVSVPLIPARQGVSGIRSQYGDSLQILMAVVALVLLIACANLANFLLARAATRQREICTRLALGSSRTRIVRQSLIETLLLSLTGGLLGLGIAFFATRALIAFVAQGRATLAMNATPDLPVLLFTLGVCLLTALLFGLAPALTSARTASTTSLSSNTRTTQSSGGSSSRFWPKALVTSQVMLSLLLLVGAGLFLRTLLNLQNQDYGFERSHLLIADFSEQLAGYKPRQTAELHQRLLERVEALPGVRSAAVAATPPISFGKWSSNVSIAGYTPAPKENTNSTLNRVSGHYFETTGIQLLAGRAITPADSATSAKVAVVNQALARHFFPKGDALGRSLSINIDTVKGPWQIVGITRDTLVEGPRQTAPPMMTTIPIAQIEPLNPLPAADSAHPLATPPVREENQDRYANVLLVRTTADPARTIADLRAAVAQLDPNLPLLNITTIHDQLSNFVSHEELVSTLTTLFAALALLLASIGLYGVMSYNVVRRTNEIGIRLALGAQTRSVLWMVLRESITLLVIGIALGLPLTYAVTRLTQDQLYGLSSLDPATFAVAIATVILMTLFAAWLPARRATRVNPMVALRYD